MEEQASTTTALPARVTIREVGPRDGLQSIGTILATDRKREWIRGAHDAGLREMEVGSFEVVAEVGKIRAARDAAGSKTLIEGGVGTAFGCTLQGRVE